MALGCFFAAAGLAAVFLAALSPARRSRTAAVAVRYPGAGVALIFVTPEKVSKSTKLRSEMEKLHQAGRLGRYVVDEW